MNSKPIKKVILTGPESTGKTTLARQLATHYKSKWISEFARDYLSNLNRPYQENDLLHIAKGQLAQEKTSIQYATNFLFCDTSLLVLKVWSEYKYGRCHPFILEQLQFQKKDFFILCGIDIPWEWDALRENPNERKELYEIYKKELIDGKFSFLEVKGTSDERIQKVISHLNLEF